jgi:hypothetical protein
MAKRTWQIATITVAVLMVVGVIYFQHFSTPTRLPSTAQLLSDEQMQNIQGGSDIGEEPIGECCCDPSVHDLQ